MGLAPVLISHRDVPNGTWGSPTVASTKPSQPGSPVPSPARIAIWVTAAFARISRRTSRGRTDREARESAHWSRSRALTSSGFGTTTLCPAGAGSSARRAGRRHWCTRRCEPGPGGERTGYHPWPSPRRRAASTSTFTALLADRLRLLGCASRQFAPPVALAHDPHPLDSVVGFTHLPIVAATGRIPSVPKVLAARPAPVLPVLPRVVRGG